VLGAGGISLRGLVGLGRRHRRLFALVPPAVVLLALAAYFVLGRPYLATSRFVPQQRDANASRLGALAAQFGLSVAPASAGDSPDFYVQLLRSRTLLTDVLQARFAAPEGPAADSAALLDILDAEGDIPEERLREGVDELHDLLGTRVDLKTGIVTVTTTAETRALAEAVNRRLLDLVNDFNLERRQSQAAAERAFVEQRMLAVQRELEAAEGALQAFLARNRLYEGSPALEFEYARLQRRVQLRQGVYTSLAQAFEQARIDEVRNTPVITIIEQPEGSARPAGRGALATAAVALVLGVVLALFASLAAELRRQLRTTAPQGAARAESHASELASTGD
jgi:uncharacterized protein involved in exopolysaccharide biosynthesis